VRNTLTPLTPSLPFSLSISRSLPLLLTLTHFSTKPLETHTNPPPFYVLYALPSLNLVGLARRRSISVDFKISESKAYVARSPSVFAFQLRGRDFSLSLYVLELVLSMIRALICG
jgi:hypothetical protein